MSFITSSPHRVTEDQARAVQAPPRTKSWDPIPHGDIIDMAVEKITAQGFDIVESNFSMTTGSYGGRKIVGANLFAEFLLKGNEDDELRKAVGLRNSVIQKYTAALCMGDYVAVCDNGMFSGDLTVTHMHTSQIRERLPELFEDAMGQYLEKFQQRQEQVRNWKAIEIDPRMADHLVMEGRRRNAIRAKDMMPILAEFNKPRHVEFEDPTVWSFSNAYTEIQKTRTSAPKLVADETVRMAKLLGEMFPTVALN